MTYPFKNKIFSLTSIVALSGLALLARCRGGSGGSSSTAPPVPGATPSPYAATYNATFAPTAAIPADGQAPTGNLTVNNTGRASLNATFYLQQSVVDAVQKAINDGLTNAGYSRAIPDNQVPKSIVFTGSGQVDGSGKLVLTSRKSVDICGSATLTIDPTFTSNGATSAATGTYQITFPNNLTIELSGSREVSGTCNNLPLRQGTVAFNR